MIDAALFYALKTWKVDHFSGIILLMLISATIAEKHMGSKLLFRDLKFTMEEGVRVGLIGRNGICKSTLFGLLSGEDTDYLAKAIYFVL